MTSTLIGGTPAPTPSDLLHQVNEDEVRFVNLQFVDIAGTLKTVTVPDTQLPAIIESGKWFDGSAIDAFARTAESDMYLWPDLSTYALLPWKTVLGNVAMASYWLAERFRTPADGELADVFVRRHTGAGKLGPALALLGVIIVASTDLFHSSSQRLFLFSLAPLLLLVAVLLAPVFVRQSGSGRAARLIRAIRGALLRVRTGLRVFRDPRRRHRNEHQRAAPIWVEVIDHLVYDTV